MRLNKVYLLKTKELVVCFKGAHYVAPRDTRVTSKKKVPVIKGETPNTVLVNGSEVWMLKGEYTTSTIQKAQPKKARVKKPRKKAKSPSVKDQHVLREISEEDIAHVVERFRDIVVTGDAVDHLKARFKLWALKQKGHPFRGVNYPDPEVTAEVIRLGDNLIKQFSSSE